MKSLIISKHFTFFLMLNTDTDERINIEVTRPKIKKVDSEAEN
jgi:hypothetical protein